MTNLRRTTASAALSFLLLAACTDGPANITEEEESADETETGLQSYAELSQEFRDDGYTTEESNEQVTQPFFSVQGRELNLDGETVQVFEFGDEESAAQAAAQVSADGSQIGTTMVNWVAPPHFYQSGRLVVLYVGENDTVLDALDDVLGDQFAGR